MLSDPVHGGQFGGIASICGKAFQAAIRVTSVLPDKVSNSRACYAYIVVGFDMSVDKPFNRVASDIFNNKGLNSVSCLAQYNSIYMFFDNCKRRYVFIACHKILPI